MASHRPAGAGWELALDRYHLTAEKCEVRHLFGQVRAMAQEAACSAATAWGCQPGAYWASLFCPQLALAGIKLGPSCHHLSRSAQGLEVTGYSVGLHGLFTSSCSSLGLTMPCVSK